MVTFPPKTIRDDVSKGREGKAPPTLTANINKREKKRARLQRHQSKDRASCGGTASTASVKELTFGTLLVLLITRYDAYPIPG